MNSKFVFWLKSTCNVSNFSFANVKNSAEMLQSLEFWKLGFS